MGCVLKCLPQLAWGIHFDSIVLIHIQKNQGNPNRGLVNRGLGPKGGNQAKKGPSGAIFPGSFWNFLECPLESPGRTAGVPKRGRSKRGVVRRNKQKSENECKGVQTELCKRAQESAKERFCVKIADNQLSKRMLMVVSKRWFEFCLEIEFRYPLLPQFNLNLTSFLPHFNLLLPPFNLNLTSASSEISNHGLETTVYRPLGGCLQQPGTAKQFAAKSIANRKLWWQIKEGLRIGRGNCCRLVSRVAILRGRHAIENGPNAKHGQKMGKKNGNWALIELGKHWPKNVEKSRFFHFSGFFGHFSPFSIGANVSTHFPLHFFPFWAFCPLPIVYQPRTIAIHVFGRPLLWMTTLSANSPALILSKNSGVSLAKVC